MIEANLVDWIESDPLLIPIIGDRIFPQSVAEDAALPAITYSVISDQATLSMSGPTSLRLPRIQLTVVSKTQHESSKICELLKKRINAWVAVYPDMVVESCFAEGGVYLSLDYYVPPRHGQIIEAYLNWYPIV